MILVVTNAYKDEKNPYENGFIHSRILAYKKQGLDTEVFVLNSRKKRKKYEFEDVKVEVGDASDFVNRLKQDQKATICIHFITLEIVKALNQIGHKRNIVLFVHGVEALCWYERIFPGIFCSPKNVLSFIKYAVVNMITLPQIRRFLNSTQHKIIFITVSKWMRDVAEKNWKCKAKFKWNIIPNIVDCDVFKYVEKDAFYVKKILSIRPFTTGKYANDISVKCIKELIEKNNIQDINVTIIGKGPQFHKILKPIKELSQVRLENRFLNREEIIDKHKGNGLFLCPTRQDAQGVSMCEAMASGLVPITLYNTAIPEFLPDDSRLICHNVNDMVNLVIRLINNKKEFQELSRICSNFIRNKCDYSGTVKKEIDIFDQIERKQRKNIFNNYDMYFY